MDTPTIGQKQTWERLKNDIQQLKGENLQLKNENLLLRTKLKNLTHENEELKKNVNVKRKKEMWYEVGNNCYRLKCREDENRVSTHEVSFDDVEYLFNLIQSFFNDGYSYVHPTYIWMSIIFDRELDEVSVDSFNGGRNRAKYYSLYYRPLKILELMGYVHHNVNIYPNTVKHCSDIDNLMDIFMKS